MKDQKISVSKAAKLYGVPDQTLRDRVTGHISIDTLKSGRSPIFSLDEEVKLVGHLQAVAKYGYGYTRQEVVDIASDYSVQLGKRVSDNPLTINWFRGFIQRWPELHVIRPRALELQRAKCTSASVIDKYFDELDQVLTKYNLKEQPHLTFNIDEKGISQNHVPPYVVGGTTYPVQAVTSGKSQTTTILGCGSASGQMIPPYFVFAGHRMLPDLLKDAIPGTAGTVSETGWSNSQVFRTYLQDHFLKFAPQRQPGQYMLILLDGHKSHVSVDLIEWAKSKEIILFILPAHTSHILQPLDVACYGPLQKIYNNLCHKFTRTISGCVSRYDVCSIASKAYCKAFSPENLLSAFKRTGVYPLNKSVIKKESVLPAEVFTCNSGDSGVEVIQNENHAHALDETGDHEINSKSNKPIEDNMADIAVTSTESNVDVTEIEKTVNVNVGTVYAMQHKEASVKSNKSTKTQDLQSPSEFMNLKLKQLRAVKSGDLCKRKERKTLSKFTSGKAITEKETEHKIKEHLSKSQVTYKSKNGKAQPNKQANKKCKKQVGLTTYKAEKFSKSKKLPPNHEMSPKAGPSHINLVVSSDQDQDMSEFSDEDMSESEKCCVCKLFTPLEVRYSVSLIFTKWVQCCKCPHWVHLGYCTKEKVVRRADLFYCCHCSEE